MKEKETEFSEIIIDDMKYITELTSKYKKRVAYKKADPKVVTAMIPGTIRDIFKKEGELVREGEPVLILEAMKMRNNIAAPREGVIKIIAVKTGQLVAKNQLLFDIE